MEEHEIKKHVREGYAKVAERQSSCCAPQVSCGGETYSETTSKQIGYTDEQLQSIPDDANMGLGCGAPLQHSDLKPGETVIDLGSGGGIDCFLAAREVGETGSVIGVDMTTEMIDKARKNAENGDYKNVEFRLGEIEHMPVADNTADLIISNCVINLSPDKASVFKDAFRALKQGGRIVVSDIVLIEELPDWVRNSLTAYTGCISGAMLKEDYLKTIDKAGFTQIEVIEAKTFPIEFMENDPTAQALMDDLGASREDISKLMTIVESIKVRAYKR